MPPKNIEKNNGQNLDYEFSQIDYIKKYNNQYHLENQGNPDMKILGAYKCNPFFGENYADKEPIMAYLTQEKNKEKYVAAYNLGHNYLMFGTNFINIVKGKECQLERSRNILSRSVVAHELLHYYFEKCIPTEEKQNLLKLCAHKINLFYPLINKVLEKDTHFYQIVENSKYRQATGTGSKFRPFFHNGKTYEIDMYEALTEVFAFTIQKKYHDEIQPSMRNDTEEKKYFGKPDYINQEIEKIKSQHPELKEVLNKIPPPNFYYHADALHKKIVNVLATTQ